MLRILIEDPTTCGIGEGEKCCVFLTGAPDGFECGRTSESFVQLIVGRLAEGSLTARYKPGPETPFPTCQKERPK